jgi:hypothetical protein
MHSCGKVQQIPSLISIPLDSEVLPAKLSPVHRKSVLDIRSTISITTPYYGMGALRAWSTCIRSRLTRALPGVSMAIAKLALAEGR